MYFNLATTFRERYYNTTLRKFQSFFFFCSSSSSSSSCSMKHACIALFECHIGCYFTLGPKIDTPTVVGGGHHLV